MLITLVSEPSFKRRFMASFWLGTTAWRWSRSSPAGPYLADSGSPVPLRLRHKDTEAHAAPSPNLLRSARHSLCLPDPQYLSRELQGHQAAELTPAESTVLLAPGPF